MKNKKILSIICFVLTAVFITLGILLLPNVTDFGQTILYYVLAGLILCYVFIYLLKLAKKYNGTRQIFVIIEMVLDLVIASVLIFNSFLDFITISETFVVLGLLIYLHAIFSIMSGYHAVRYDVKKYPFYILVVDIALVTLGTIFIVRPMFTNREMIIGVSVLSFLVAAFSLVYGILLLTKLNKKKKQK